MSNRLKFRVWDGQVFWLDNNIFIKEGKAYYESNDPYDYCLFEIKNAIIQQSTGLKDKNGKEIFEGDIMQDKQGLIWEVYFNSKYGKFDIKTEILKASNYNTQIHEARFLEIVGNIFQNPELLK